MKAAQELDDWLNTASEKVQRNVKIVTPDDLGQDCLLHVSVNTNIREFIPFIGKRQSPQEDRTVPRICVCPTLLGCFIGYGDAETTFLDIAPGSPTNVGAVYKGGWKIYALPFKAALKPSGKLVWDGKHSDEHWLVPYSKDTAVYKGEAAGKAFCHAITLVGRADKIPSGEIILYVEVARDKGIQFSKQHLLTKGCWRITGPLFRNTASPADDKQHVIEEISKSDYSAAKNQTAALLGITDPVPAYLSW